MEYMYTYLCIYAKYIYIYKYICGLYMYRYPFCLFILCVCVMSTILWFNYVDSVVFFHYVDSYRISPGHQSRQQEPGCWAFLLALTVNLLSNVFSYDVSFP